MPKQKKDPWKNVPQSFRDAVESGSEAEIRAKLADLALEQQENVELMENDQDFQRLKTELAVAGETYRDTAKRIKASIKYARQTLQSRGKI